MMRTVSKALLDEKAKVMVPLGSLAALLLAYLVYMHQEVAEVRRIAERPSDLSSIMLEEINNRLSRIETLMMKRAP